MAEHRIVGFGHSHLSCLFRAFGAGKRDGAFEGIEGQFVRLNTKTFQPNFEMAGPEPVQSKQQQRGNVRKLVDRLRGRKAYDFDAAGRARVLTEALERRLKHIVARQEPDAIVLACMGNEYNSLGMLRHPEPYDFDLPGSGLPVQDGVAHISYPMMKAQMRLLAEHNVLLFWRFFHQEMPDIPKFMVPPPPPIASEDHILAYPGSFAERARAYGISSVPFRRKMWMLYCEILRETVKGTNTTFVELPDVVFSDGCLAKQFWQEDPTHGNQDYGYVILEQILDLAFTPEMEG